MFHMSADLSTALDALVNVGRGFNELRVPGLDCSVDLLFLISEYRALLTKDEDDLRVHFPPLRIAVPYLENRRDVVPLPRNGPPLLDSEEQVVRQAMQWYERSLVPAAIAFTRTMRKVGEADEPSVAEFCKALCERPVSIRERFQEERPLELLESELGHAWFDVGIIGFGDLIELTTLSGFKIPDDLLMEGFEHSLVDEGDRFSLYAYLMAHSFAKRALDNESARGAWNRYGPKVTGSFRTVAGHCYQLHGLPFHAKSAFLGITETPEEMLEDEEGSFQDARAEKVKALRHLADICRKQGDFEDCLVYLRRLEDHHCASPSSALSDEEYLQVVEGIYECRTKLQIPGSADALEQVHRLRGLLTQVHERALKLEIQVESLEKSQPAKSRDIESSLKTKFSRSWNELAVEVREKLKHAEWLFQEHLKSNEGAGDWAPYMMLATAQAVEIQLRVSVFRKDILRSMGEQFKDGLKNFAEFIRRGQFGPPDWLKIKNPSALKRHVKLIDFLAHPRPEKIGIGFQRFRSEAHASKDFVDLFEALTDWKQAR